MDWNFLKWKLCLDASDLLSYGYGVSICLRYMLILWHGVQRNIQFHYCTYNTASVDLSIHMKHVYTEYFSLVKYINLYNTMYQCYGIHSSYHLFGSKLYVPRFLQKSDLVNKQDVKW